MFELNGSLKPYLTYSAGAHAALVVALVLIAGGKGAQSPKTYRIDFIGDTGVILNRGSGAAKAKTVAAKPPEVKPPAPAPRRPLGRPALAPMRDPDAVALSKSKSFRSDLKPSFLYPRPETKGAAAAEPAPAAAAASEEQADAAPAAAEGGTGGTDVSADMPDFPYPWYLQRLRAALWHQWSLKMPAGGRECGVVFTVLRGGETVDLRVELSSGDDAFDLHALNAVKAAGPYPPLPPQFQEKFLKVHVQFKGS